MAYVKLGDGQRNSWGIAAGSFLLSVIKFIRGYRIGGFIRGSGIRGEKWSFKCWVYQSQVYRICPSFTMACREWGSK